MTRQEYVAALIHRASELMVQHPEWSVDDCAKVAAEEHLLIYGDYEGEAPPSEDGVTRQ